MKSVETNSIWLVLGVGILFLCSACQPQATPFPTFAPTPSLSPSPSPEPDIDCSKVERLPNDSQEAQKILEEFVLSFRKQQPTEYMGMALLGRVDRLEGPLSSRGYFQSTDLEAVASSLRSLH